MSIFKLPKKPKPKQKQSWYIRYFIPNGRDPKGRKKYIDKWESVGPVGLVNRSQAEALLAERKKQIRSGKIDPKILEPPTLSEFAPDYLKFQKEVKRIRSWNRDKYSLKHLLEYFGHVKLSNITVDAIDKYRMARLEKGINPSTVNRETQCLRNLINVARRWQRISGDNPVSKAGLLPEIHGKRKILSLEEEQRLLEASPPQLAALIEAALYTGMRISELINLKKSDIDIVRSEIILEATMTKGKRERYIPIDEEFMPTLRDKILKSKSDYIFTNRSGDKYQGHDSIVPIFARAAKRAGLTGISFHTLRHTWITRALEEGAAPVAVKEIAGHADLKTTMRYTHPEASLRDAVNRVSAYRRKNLRIETSEFPDKQSK
jgi:integrase